MDPEIPIGKEVSKDDRMRQGDCLKMGYYESYMGYTPVIDGISMNIPTYIYIYIYTPSGPQVSARGGVGWGMLTSCSWYVDATVMGGVGWGGACSRHVHVPLMLR